MALVALVVFVALHICPTVICQEDGFLDMPTVATVSPTTTHSSILGDPFQWAGDETQQLQQCSIRFLPCLKAV